MNRQRLYTVIASVLVVALGCALITLMPAARAQHDGHDHADHESHAGHDDHTDERPDTHADHDDHDGHGDMHDNHADHDDHQSDAHDDHDDHDDHAGHGHDDHDDDGILRIDPETRAEFGIEVQAVGPGTIARTLRLPGQIQFNADRVANITPTVDGIARHVHRSVGDRVKAGDEMAVLSSRELAAARSDYVTAMSELTLAEHTVKAIKQLYDSRVAIAEETLSREKSLLEQRVGTERDVLESQAVVRELRATSAIEALRAEQAVRQAQIALKQAESVLHALGYSHEAIDALAATENMTFTSYALTSPIDGIVTERHITAGEVIGSEHDPPFIVADLSTVWVNLTVQPRDLSAVKPGAHVRVVFGHGVKDGEGEIAFVSPVLDAHTRTASARVVLDNSDGRWKPGMFISGAVTQQAVKHDVVLPRTAVQDIEGQTAVFIVSKDGFEPREITLGDADAQHVAVLKGLKAGDRVVVRNGLALKAEMNRAALEHAGHAH